MPKSVTVRLGPWKGVAFNSRFERLGSTDYIFFNRNYRMHSFDIQGERCGVELRRGTQRTHAAALTLASRPTLFAWDKGAQLLVKGNSTTLYYTTSTSIPYTWSTATTPSTGGNGYNQFAAFRDASADVVYMSDASANGLTKWTGVSPATSVGGGVPANLGGLAVYNSRLFAFAATAATSSTLYWSGLNNGDTLGVSPNGGSAVIRHYKDDPITGLLALGQTLFIFHNKSISKFTGWSQDDFNISDGLRGFSPDTGMPVSGAGTTGPPQTLIAVGAYGYFWDSDQGRCYRFTEGGLEDISENIRTDLIQYGYQGVGMPAAVIHIPARQEIWWKVANSTNVFYGWNYGLEQWVGKFEVPTGGNVTSGTLWGLGHALYTDSAGFVRELFHDPASTVYKDDVLSDGTGGSTPFNPRLAIKIPDLGGEAALRRLRIQMVTHGVDPNGETEIAIDTGGAAVVEYPIAGSPALPVILPGSDSASSYDINASGYGRRFTLYWALPTAVTLTVRPPTLVGIEAEFLVYTERSNAGAFHQ